MIFWRIEELKTQIQMGLLTESAYFKYLLLSITLNIITIEFSYYLSAEDPSYLDYAESAVYVLVAFLGTILAFYANGGRQGKKFMEKYFAIGFVTSVRFFIYSIPVLSLYSAFYFYAINEVNVNLTKAVDFFPFLILYLLTYWRIYVHIKQTNS